MDANRTVGAPALAWPLRVVWLTLVLAASAHAAGPSVEAVEHAGPAVPVDLKNLVKVDPAAFGVAGKMTMDRGPLLQSLPASDVKWLDVRAVSSSTSKNADLVLYDAKGVGSRIDPQTARLAFDENSVLAIGSRQPAVAVRTAAGHAFFLSSSQWITRVASTTSSTTDLGTASLRSLGLAWQPATLQWNPTDGAFETIFFIGLADRLRPEATESLQQPISVQVSTRGGRALPMDVLLRHVGYPFEKIAISSDGTTDPLPITMASAYGPQKPPVTLAVLHPQLNISAPDQIPGWGLGFAEIVVSPIGVSPAPGKTITLMINRGSVPDRSVKVDPSGVATTRLQSEGLEGTWVQLAPGPFHAQPIRIAFVTPWSFLIAMTGGATLGALCLVLSDRRKARQRRIAGLLGMLVGCGATAMAYAGMALPMWVPVPTHLVGEVVPFALAFFCSLASTALLRTWLKPSA